MTGIVYLAVGAALGIGIALLCIWAYRRGIKDGMSTVQNRTPDPIIPPKGEPVDAEVMDKFDKIMSYDPYGGVDGQN